MIKIPTLTQKCFAEFIGTAFLVLIGAGAATAAGRMQGPLAPANTLANLGFVGLAFGIAIAIMVYAIGHISGCHINPAVTIAFAALRRMSWSEAAAYVISQLIGGIIGGLIIALAFGRAGALVSAYGATNFNEATTGYLVATIIEAIATFFLLFVITRTAIDDRSPYDGAGLMIGLTVTGAIIAFGVITGASLNPARTIGPVVATWIVGGTYPILHLIPYIIGPIVGGIVGVLAYEIVAGIGVIERPHYQNIEAKGGE